MLVPSRRLAVSAAVAVCLLAGCQLPSMSPTPAPTFRCTPEAGGAEYECSPHQYDEMVAKDKLYAEAEAVYRRFLAEDIRIARAGGLSEPTQMILETSAGAFLEDVVAEYRQNKGDGITVRGGDRLVESVTRLVGAAKGGSIVTMRVCVNSSSVDIFKNGKRLGKGLVTRDDLYFARFDTRLKIIGADGEEVDSCESA